MCRVDKEATLVGPGQGDIYYQVGLSSHMTTITNQRRNQPGKTIRLDSQKILAREKFVRNWFQQLD